MVQIAERLVSAAVAVSIVGCTSMQPVSPVRATDGGAASAAGQQARPLASGSFVRVQQHSGATVELVVTAVDDLALQGTSGGRAVRIDWTDVAVLETRRLDWVRTGLLLLGIVALGQLAGGLARGVNPTPP